MELVAVQPERVEVALHFDKPFTSDNDLSFLLEPRGGGTHVTWRMTGQVEGVMMSLFTRVMSMDRLVGKDFERGLDRLDVVASRG